MKTVALDGSDPLGVPGIFRGKLTFSNKILAEFEWPLVEIRGNRPGPRLCISAGVHVNEVSSIEAAIRLQGLFEPDTMRGSVSIIPVINQPALYQYIEYLCPIDGKNINFTFPGSPSGTFSEVLCDAIQHHWCADADCYVDLHGGDLREQVSKFTIFQRTDNDKNNRLSQDLAMCFDADIVVGLPREHLNQLGRPPTGFARENRIAIMAEAGGNGLLDEESINFHVQGVLKLAGRMGIAETAAPKYQRRRIVCDNYLWVKTPEDGQFYADCVPGQRVKRSQRLGSVRDYFGRYIAEITAPEDGLVLWIMTHPTLREGSPALAVAIEEILASPSPQKV